MCSISITPSSFEYFCCTVLKYLTSVGCVHVTTTTPQNGCYHDMGCLYSWATFSLHLWSEENKGRHIFSAEYFLNLTTNTRTTRKHAQFNHTIKYGGLYEIQVTNNDHFSRWKGKATTRSATLLSFKCDNIKRKRRRFEHKTQKNDKRDYLFQTASSKVCNLNRKCDITHEFSPFA